MTCLADVADVREKLLSIDHRETIEARKESARLVSGRKRHVVKRVLLSLQFRIR